jgi:REP element-mobilizing transposase RayT
MAGLARGDLAEGTYHVTTRSTGPIPMFVDDVDRTYFCGVLWQTTAKYGWRIPLFCLMRTHFHLLVDCDRDNMLQAPMKSLNWRYAWWFNRRHGRAGHLVGRRYWCARTSTAGHLLHAARYIARNPVAAGFCDRPEDWPWSGYTAALGMPSPFGFVDASALLAYFDEDQAEAAASFRRFVSAA